MTYVERRIELAAEPEAVFAMLTDPAGLTRWLCLSADCEPRPGGRFRVEVAPGAFAVGVYVVVDPPRRVVFTWGYEDAVMGVGPGSSTVDVVLEPAATGTRLQLRHDGLPGDAHGLHAEGWERFLDRLDAVARGTGPGPHPDETPDERRAALRGGAP